MKIKVAALLTAAVMLAGLLSACVDRADTIGTTATVSITGTRTVPSTEPSATSTQCLTGYQPAVPAGWVPGVSYAPWLDSYAYTYKDGVLAVDIDDIYIWNNIDTALGHSDLSVSYDGGETFIPVPCYVGSQDNGPLLYALYISKNLTAMAYYSNADGLTHVAVSADAGQTWTTVPVNDSSPTDSNLKGYFIQFTDQDHGWLAAAYVPPDIVDGACFKLFSTADGGASWSEVYNTDNFYSRTGDITGITFINAKTGFISIDHGYWTGPLMFRTDDGGVTWTGQDLPWTMEGGTPRSPVFDGADGILPVKLGDGEMVFFKTNDNGETWTCGAGIPVYEQ